MYCFNGQIVPIMNSSTKKLYLKDLFSWKTLQNVMGVGNVFKKWWSGSSVHNSCKIFYLSRKASFLVQNLKDLVQDLARFTYFLQDTFTGISLVGIKANLLRLN